MPEEEKVKLVELFKKPNIFKHCWWRIENFFREWIYPAYSLKNSLFYRYDIVRMRDIPRTQYCDVVERMFYANMELITHFMEKENPEKYVCWYQNESGEDVGHKYGEYEEKANIPILFPEYKGKFVMDIIKEIYHWWKVEYPRMCNEREYILSFWCKYICGTMKSKPWKDSDEYSEIVFDKSDCPTTMEFFNDKEVKWEILDKYLDGDRGNLLKDGFLKDKLDELEIEIERQMQKCLHLCIEVRTYLWT